MHYQPRLTRASRLASPLAAQVIYTWIDRPPAAPPLNVLSLPWKLLRPLFPEHLVPKRHEQSSSVVDPSVVTPGKDAVEDFCYRIGLSESFSLLHPFRTHRTLRPAGRQPQNTLIMY